MVDDVATVAAGLSAQERSALSGGTWNVTHVASRLIDRLLVARASFNMVDITPLGLSVRDHILKEQKGC